MILLRSLAKLGIASLFKETHVRDSLLKLRTHALGPVIHVLAYHRVVDRIRPGASQSLCITTGSFRRQMEQVRRTFRVLSLAEVIAALRGKLALDRDACAITFDDGYRDVLLRAHPILRELEIPAALFVPSGLPGQPLPHDRLFAALETARARGVLPWSAIPEPLRVDLGALHMLLWQPVIDGPSIVDTLIAGTSAEKVEALTAALEAAIGPTDLDEDARVLNPTELRELAEAGWEIGSHTIGHVALIHESSERVRRELAESKSAIESWTGRPCRYFAYCNGLHDPEIVRALYACGYQGAVTTYDRPNSFGTDPMRIGRKTLWEGHVRGLRGEFEPALSEAQLHDLFGALGLTTPIYGGAP